MPILAEHSEDRNVAEPMIIDTHVHIFERGMAMAAERRYAPGYDATAAMLGAEMATAGVGHAVLVQPSFLGTDNSYILDAIARDPARFSGIAVVPPEIGVEELHALKAGGIHGVRLNLIGKAVPDFAGAQGGLVATLAGLGMVLQIQAEGAQWRALAAFLQAAHLPVIIDHFGRTPQGDASGGFAALLKAAKINSRLWFKFSAPYRFADGAAAACAQAILDVCGPDRILWGSDWPWTQHEDRHAYADTLRWLEEWVPEARDRQRIVLENPNRLFGLGR